MVVDPLLTKYLIQTSLVQYYLNRRTVLYVCRKAPVEYFCTAYHCGLRQAFDDQATLATILLLYLLCPRSEK
jgi:hypothetical protein